MATVLLTWELGAGLGHLVNLLPFAKGLSQRGHRVFAAVRDLRRAGEALGGSRVTCLQAPIQIRRTARVIDPPSTFPHLLHNSGFANAGELRSLAEAWRSLYDLIQPDLVVFDHSPTALLAARGYAVKRALLGTGFFCPLDDYPMPDLRPWASSDPARLREDEDRVCANANAILLSWKAPLLERLSGLYQGVDENFLATFPELDHYPGRKGATYWGVWQYGSGKAPVWPEGPGKRVFAYLKPFPAVPQLLGQLADLRSPVIVFGDGIDQGLVHRFQSDRMCFESEPLDIQTVSASCDLAILNGNHGTTVAMLLAGKPSLQIPLFLEQGLFSEAVERLGAGLIASANQPDNTASSLATVLDAERYTAAAKAFAERYASYDWRQQVKKVVDRVEELLRPNRPSAC